MQTKKLLSHLFMAGLFFSILPAVVIAQLRTANVELNKPSAIYAPREDVEFSYEVGEGLAGKVWIGLMRYCDPHRNLKFEDRLTDISRFEPKSLDSGKGVVTFSAPQADGVYQVRIFEKTSGRELAVADFEVLNAGASTAPSPDTAPSPEGNWTVEWMNAPSESAQTAFLVLSKTPEFKCWQNPSGRGCWYRHGRSDTAAWTLGGIANINQGSRWEIVHGVTKLEVEPSRVKVNYFPYVRNQGEEVRNLGTDSPEGSWTSRTNGKDMRGRSNWRRAVPKVTRAVFHYNAGPNSKPDKRESATAPNERRAEVHMAYDSFWWGPQNDMRGNRPGFRVDIYGENLWGVHYPFLDPRTRLELDENYYICGNGERNKGWTACNGPRGGVVGISYELNVWNGVKPGTKMMFLDGFPITFELKMPSLCGQGASR